MSGELIFIRANSEKYLTMLKKLQSRLGANLPELLREEARLFIRDVMKLTPPQNRRQGMDAITRDLRRVVEPLDPARITNPGIREAVRKGDVAAMSAIARISKDGPLAGKTIIGDIGEFKSLHLSRRNRRGRVSGSTNTVMAQKTWKVYWKSIQWRVGFAKAGWLNAARRLGAKVPVWVGRFGTRAPGGYIETDAGNLHTVTLINEASKIPDYQRTVNFAMGAREHSLLLEGKRLLEGGKTRRRSFAGTLTGGSGR